MYRLIDSFPSFPLLPTQVYVVSDSDYKEYQRKQAEQDVLALESKLNRYNTAVEEIKIEIETIQKRAGLLAPSERELNENGSGGPGDD